MYFTKDDEVPVVTTFTITGTKENNETLNGGYTHKVNVTYNIKWDATDVVSYCISTSQSSCNGNWVNVSGTSVSPTEPVLDNTEGKKTRYAFIKDSANNISSSKEASITLDLNNPIVNNVTYKSKDTSSITVKVEGTDGNTGSGIVKYECKATTKDIWYQQDSSGNCKVTGLTEGTQYTIEGRVTDTSGRVSINSLSITQSTESPYNYKCLLGEEMIQDSQKGSSSGGYICKASASSKGWTYEQGSCSTGSYYTISGSGKFFQSYSDALNYFSSNGWSLGNYKSGSTHQYCYYCALYYNGERVDTKGGCAYPGGSHVYCESSDWENYIVSSSTIACSLDNSGNYSSVSSCESSCRKYGEVGDETKSVYFCDKEGGWNNYSGSGSSLVCYRPALKLADGDFIASDLLSTKPKGLNTTLQGDLYRYQGNCNAASNGCDGKVNNFICFGNGASCSLTSDYMYRIIGVTIDGRLKVIKNTAIVEGSTNLFLWNDVASNLNWVKGWAYDRLNGLVQYGAAPSFVDSTQYPYMSKSGDWYKKIDDATWKYGDITNNSWMVKAPAMYDLEAKLTGSVTAKIGLMYLNEYYYSGEGGNNDCSEQNGYASTCKKSWLHISNNGYSSNQSLAEWTITRYGASSGKYWAWYVRSSGSVYATDVSQAAMRPVFYIKSDAILSGSGTSTDPYVVQK